MTNINDLEVGYDVPAVPGMDESDIQTPCLVVDLDALERNIRTMGQLAKDMGVFESLSTTVPLIFCANCALNTKKKKE